MEAQSQSQSQSQIRLSLLRARETFDRRPSAALNEDSTAVATWCGGLSTRLSHPSMPQLGTDLPSAIGGADGNPSPGWYFRAGLASCMATSIAMDAAIQGIALTRLEVEAHTESDARGMLGTPGVPAGPLRCRLKVTLWAPDTPDAALRELVASAGSHSPMAEGVRHELDVGIDVELAPRPAA